MKLRIEKIKEVENPTYPHNIPVGYVKEMFVNEESLPPTIGERFPRKPTIGERFPRNTSWSTSVVQEIIDDCTFRTLNSIYTWEIIDEQDNT